jgi:hypothetical protein
MELLGKMAGIFDVSSGSPGNSLADVIRAAYEKRTAKEEDTC